MSMHKINAPLAYVRTSYNAQIYKFILLYNLSSVISPLQGFCFFLTFPRALPWATIFHPFGVPERAIPLSLPTYMANLFVGTHAYEGLMVYLITQRGCVGNRTKIWVSCPWHKELALTSYSPNGAADYSPGQRPISAKIRTSPHCRISPLAGRVGGAIRAVRTICRASPRHIP